MVFFPTYNGAIFLFDIDQDAYLDLFTSGYNDDILGSQANMQLNYFNATSDSLIYDFSGMNMLAPSQADPGDYDNDNDPDVLYNGQSSIGEMFTCIYSNEVDTFIDVASSNIRDMGLGGVAWVDYNIDGKNDFIIAGMDNVTDLHTKLYKNTGSGFTEDFNLGLNPMYNTTYDFADINKDGYKDMLLTGTKVEGYEFSALSQIWINKNGIFEFEPSYNLLGLTNGDAQWCDMDADGDYDFVMVGQDKMEITYYTRVMRNDNGSFTAIDLDYKAGIKQGTAQWGDYDNDGDSDLLVTGINNLDDYYTAVWRNDDSAFTEDASVVWNVGLSDAQWGDYNNDHKLDFIISGKGIVDTDTMDVGLLYENTASSINTAPTIPQNLRYAVDSNTVTLLWDRSTDLQTPVPGISYNVRIGSKPGKTDILSPLADLNTGKRFIVHEGNAGINDFYKIKLPPGHYYWSVQAIDNGYKESAFAREQDFYVIPSNANEICMVRNDSLSGKNMVVWERIQGYGVASYKIYKEMAANDFVGIGTVSFDSLSVFVDNTSNPKVQSEAYKIAVLDSNGVEMAKGDFHRTIHLGVSQDPTGRLLTWNNYLDEKGNKAFGKNGTGLYYIYRGTHPDSLVMHTQLSTNNNSWTDTDTSQLYYYRIACKKLSACAPMELKASGGPYSRAVSNLEDNRLKEGESIMLVDKRIESFKVKPNPFLQYGTISYQLNYPADVSLEIIDLYGTKSCILVNQNQSPGYYEYQINRKAFNSTGVYFIRLKANNTIRWKKIIVM
jgi:hypothetical protein